MASKRKSVTFRENVSMIYPKNFDGSSSPAPINTAPINTAPTTAAQPLTLDPMYLTWLRGATKTHYPFIVNGTFARHVYRQNFEEHIRIKNIDDFQRAQKREAAVPALAERYGSLGWGTLYREVSETAWVKNYREIYRFDGSDEYLLEKMAEAFDEIKHAIAEEEKVYAQFTQDTSIYSALSARQWVPFTQGGGALVSPNFGPSGVNVTFKDATDAPFDTDESVRFAAGVQETNGRGMQFDMSVVSRDFGDAMLNVRTEARILSAGL